MQLQVGPIFVQASPIVLLLLLCLAYIVGRTLLRLFKHAQAEGWTGIKSTVLTMICFSMFLLGILLFDVSMKQQEHVPDSWLIPALFTWPLFFSYPLAIFRLLTKPIPQQRTRQEILDFHQQRHRGLTLAAMSAAFGLCPSVVVCVALLFERPWPLLSIGYLCLFSTLQVFLLRSVKHTYTASNESAVVWKRIVIGLIGSVLFILVMLMVGFANL